jgi:hypothetical protein
MPRNRHPKKAVEDALRYAEINGWRVEIGGSHAGVEFTVLIMTKTVGVGSSVLQVYGAHPPTHQIMEGRFGGLSIIALPGRAVYWVQNHENI